MDSLLKNLPDIIMAAASSKRGLVALAIVAASAVVCLLFRRSGGIVRFFAYVGLLLGLGLFVYWGITTELNRQSTVIINDPPDDSTNKRTRPCEADELLGRAREKRYEGRMPAAMVSFRNAADRFERDDQEKCEVMAWLGIADTRWTMGQTHDSRIAYNKALELARIAKFRAGEAHALIGLGQVAYRLGEPHVAGDRYDEAEAIAARANDVRARAYLALAFGNLADLTGQQDEARSHYTSALSHFETISDDLGEAQVFMRLGELEGDTGNSERARGLFNKALGVYETRGGGYPYGQAEVTRWFAELAKRDFDHHGSLAHYNKAFALYDQVDNPVGKAAALRGMADVYLNLALWDKATKHYRDALNLSRIAKDTPGEAEAYLGLATLTARQRDLHGAAENSYETALDLYHRIGDRVGEGNAYFGLGDVKRVMQQWSKAREYFRKAKRLFSAANHSHGIARIHHGLGDLALEENSLDEAERYLKNALRTFRPSERLGQANVQVSIGLLRLRQGNPNQAHQEFHVALEIFKEIKHDFDQARVFFWLGCVEKRRGSGNSQSHRRAQEYHDKARQILEEYGSPPLSDGACPNY